MNVYVHFFVDEHVRFWELVQTNSTYIHMPMSKLSMSMSSL